MALAQHQAPEPQEGIHSFFDAPFTAVCNRLMESIVTNADVNPAMRLLLFIARFSTGYLKAEVVLRESFILEQTGMSRSSLYKAKNDLLASGHITIGHTQTGNCIYRLAPQYQCMKGATSAQERASQKWGSPVTEHGGPQVETPMYKENKENLDQHHQSVPATPTPTDDDFSISCPDPVDSIEPLVEHLKQLGVNEFMAHRLTRSKPAEIIERAISRVRSTEVTNPAGYLVSEILRGGYQPKPDPTKAQRALHREIQEKRQAERLKLEQEHQHSQTRAEQLWQKFLALPVEHQLNLKQRIQSQAEREGFARLRGWGEEHPTWRGLILEELLLWQAEPTPVGSS